MFTLHERLAADTVPLGRLDLCRLLLMNDAAWPWLILVPEVPGACEIHDLDQVQRATLMEEITLVSRVLTDFRQPDKINIAALGNMVPQLHVHVVARFRSDPAWPAPIWGRMPAQPYPPAEAASFGAQIAQRLGAALITS